MTSVVEISFHTFEGQIKAGKAAFRSFKHFRFPSENVSTSEKTLDAPIFFERAYM
jgi:hypothetical protein